MKCLAPAVAALLLLTGCGDRDVRFRDYRTSLAQSYAGSPATTRAFCVHEEQKASGEPFYTLVYQRFAYANGDSYVSCSVLDESNNINSHSYFAVEAGVFDGSCSTTLTDGTQSIGTWAFTHSATSTGATVSSSDANLNGWNVTFADCLDQ
jgi:hypothetical protein